jgi:hypothetical protein
MKKDSIIKGLRLTIFLNSNLRVIDSLTSKRPGSCGRNLEIVETKRTGTEKWLFSKNRVG